MNVTSNLVRVVVKGNKREIESFYRAVSDYCKTELKLEASRVKSLQKYKGAEPEWQAMASFSTAEQLTKGIDYLQSIDNQFRDARNRFDNIGRGVNVVNEQVKILPDLVREMKGLREDTTEEMREMRKVISKFTGVVEKLVKE